MKNEKINNLDLISSSEENTENKKIECFKFFSLIILVVFLFTKISSSKTNKISFNSTTNKISFNLSNKSSNQNRIDEVFITNIKNVLDPDEICENEMMNKHTTFRIGVQQEFLLSQKQLNIWFK